MKKSIEKILMLLLAISLVFTYVGVNLSYAAEPAISVSSAVVGQSFTVTVSMPEGTVSCSGNIEIIFSDKSKINEPFFKYTGSPTDEYETIEKLTFSYTAAKEGETTVKVTGLSCSSKDAEKLNGQSTLSKTFTIVSNTPETPSAPSTPSTPTEPSAPTTPTTPVKPETPSTSNEPTWRETGDTVYALESLNVRSGWDTSYSKIGSLTKDSSTKRIAVGSNGWDKIEYNGSIGYVVSKYLTTEKPEENTTDTEEDDVNEPTWRETGDTVYALQKLNVRSGWGTSYKAIGMLKKNAETKRIAVGSNGWDKIEYNGKTAYVMSKYLTTEKPEEDIEEDKVKNEVDNNVVENTNTVQNNIVNQAEIYNKLVDEVGVIPPVGKSVVDYIYIIGVCITIGMIAIVGIKIRENDKE